MENKLPKNWVETELGNYVYLKNGYAFKSSDFCNIGIPVVKISNIIDGKIDINDSKCIDQSIAKTEFRVNKGDILIAMSGATTGKFGIYELDDVVMQNQRVGNIKPLIDKLSHKKFIYYLLFDLKQDIETMAYGGAQPNISPQLISSLQIPLPPLAEQKRIADKLDILFGQLETIRKATDRIPELIKNFRQQILTYAITGRLTAHKGHVHILADHLQSIKYGTSKKSDYNIVDGIPVLRIPNIKDGEVDLTDLKYSLFDNKEYQQLRLNKGDILVIRSNGSISLVGQSAIVDMNCDGFCYAGYLIRLRFNNDILPDFINYSFRSEFVRKQIIDLAHSTSGVNNINAQQIQNLSFVYFEKSEQKEIVSSVQSLFEKLETIERRYQTLKIKLEDLPQALLHKAFKGELVEQLPTDGNAADLLREIEQLKKFLKNK